MAFVRPTLSDLVTRIQADFVSRMSLVGAVLRRSVVYILARVIAGAAHMLHGHLEFLSLQVFPDKSQGEFLVRQARLFGITRNAAVFATGTATVTGSNGTVIPAGSRLRRADGAEYLTNADVTIAGGVATPALTAVVAGLAGNAIIGVVLNFESPIAGANSAVTVVSLVNGTDEESDDLLRVRLLARMNAPPHGGAAADYIAWAKEVAGVTRAWCTPLANGAGTVAVHFVRDDDSPIIPDAGEVAAVQTHIDLVRPVTATLTVYAPTADPVAFTIHIVPDTTDTRAAVTAALDDLIRRDAAPGGTILLSHMRDSIGTATGITDYTLTTPAANSTHAAGHLATRGTITWT